MGAFGKVMESIAQQAGFLALMYVAVVVLVGLDLWSGVRKAKERGEARMSFGYRKTLDKLVRYFNLIFVVGVVDVIVLLSPVYEAFKLLPPFPYLTLIGTIVVGLIEFKSIREKAEEKSGFKSASILAGKVIASRDDISKIVEEVVLYLDTPDKKYAKRSNARVNKKDSESV